jgi:hypothetical protein
MSTITLKSTEDKEEEQGIVLESQTEDRLILRYSGREK